jgi:hypothetical protein
MRWILRASSGRFGPDHAGKVRFVLERPSDAASFEAEGTLSLGHAAPRFDGKISAARNSGGLPWRISSDASGDLSEIRFAGLELALGVGELPVTLSGEAKLAPHASGVLEVSLSSKRVDLDLGDQKAAAAGAAHVLPMLSQARQLMRMLPLPAQIAVSADGILAGGQLVRDARAQFRVNDGAVTLELLEAKLPGRAAIALSGRNESGKFSGPLSFETDEPQIFARWLLGEEVSGRIQAPPSLALNTMLVYARDEILLDDFQAAVADTRLGGRLLIQEWSDGKSYVVQADLKAERANFDAILPVLNDVSGLLKDQKFTMNLYAEDARLLKRPLKRMRIALTHLAGGLQIKNFSIDDLAGVSLSGKYSSGSESVFEFSGEALRPSGFAAILEYFSGSADLANVISKYADSHFPLRVTGTVSPTKTGWRAALKSGDASFALSFGELRDARRPVDAMLRLPETEIEAKGELRFGPGGRFEPVLSVNLKSADLRKGIPLANRVSANALPASGSTALSRDGNNIVFDKLSFELAGTRGQGRIVLPFGEVSPFSGNLSLDRANAGTLLALAVGRANVSYVELGIPLLANIPGRLKVEIGALAISERLSFQKAAFEFRVGRVETVFDDFQAQLAGGKISGSLRTADTFPRVLELKLDTADVALAQLLAAKPLRGTLRASLALGASGNTEDELLTSLAGQGTIALTNFELDRADATAVASVFAASAKETPDEARIEQALLAALERGPLKISRLETPLVVANGVLRSGSAKAKAGNIEIALSGSLHIPKRNVEALLNIEVLGNSAVRPGAALRWQGPLESPERKIDAKALITAITLRAIERGSQNPSNIDLPQEDRLPAKKKKMPVKSDIETAPLLPPPANIPPAPQPRSQQ